MLEQFHFLEPLYLLALLPLIVIFFLAFRENTDSRAWGKIIDADLLPLLLKGKDRGSNKFAKFILAIAWFTTVIALADPAWEKIPRPVFQTNTARIIILDLSNSMLIEDVKPSRLTRARFKIEDILSRKEEGQTGLVLFAGEAFTAAPLTRDTKTISSLLKVLTPQILPAQGSRADLGLIKAHELLKQAGILNGRILLIADGVSQKQASLNAARDLLSDGHTVSVMAVGTETGGTLNFRNNVTKTIKLEPQTLIDIAKNGGGNYHLMTTNNSDLKHLLTPISDNSSLTQKKTNGDQEIQNTEWHSMGPILVLLLLPFAALAFRRGWLLNLAAVSVVLSFMYQPQEAYAAKHQEQTNTQSKWQDWAEKLTKNRAQRANQALVKKRYEQARDLSNDPLTRGSAEYKLENYEDALTHFKQAEGADARYNEGNSLAKLQKYEDAIAAYDKALALDSTMQDALDNKKAIEDFIKQQQSKDQQQSSDENQQNNSDSKEEQQDQQNGDSQDNQEGTTDQENQFSDANQELDKNKKETEEKKAQASEDQPEKSDEGEEKSQQNAEEAQDKEGENDSLSETKKQRIKELAEELNKEEKMAAEQWLRRIPDDPGGLLRRKFKYQYNQNRRNSNSRSKENPW